MKKRTNVIVTAMMMLSGIASAQTQNDPVIMTINGQPVLRSEFEYSYNKNNTDGVIDKKSVEEYVDLFINYKLKVLAAEDERLDTVSSIRREFETYRDQQIRPAMITDADVEAKARELYDEAQQRVDANGGLVQPLHILVMMRQDATADQQAAAKQRIDSIYSELKRSEDFEKLATKYSEDPQSARRGGSLGWVEKGYLYKEFEDVCWNLKPGETSRPFTTPAGWHIVKVLDKSLYPSYDSLRTNIVNYIEHRGLRTQIIDQKIEELAKAQNKTTEEVLAEKRTAMEAEDPSLKYLIQEYHDGLLLIDLAMREVYNKAQNDEAGLNQYFKKNKKQYKWEEPRFKGMAYRARYAEDVPAVKKAVKGLPFDKWAQTLRETFNNDSVLRIRVEKGYFKNGDNKIVDKEVFKTRDKVDDENEQKGMKKLHQDYPYTATYGKLLKSPKALEDVRGQVVNDYQEYLMDQWVAKLRKKYKVEVDKSVLATVNKHD
ncbi:MAG: peptidylprolyl isomerase [Prevotella sp.]|nr:peptidylprolyl isomerase [Prevotella sp.]